MSAPAAVQTKEDFLALIVAMGGEREKGFDPFPPDQYTAFLDQDLQLSPRGHNLLALIRFRCLRPKKGGRTPYATDERGRPLQKKQVAEFFGWDLPAVSKIWKELEEKQLVKEKDGKLWLNGTVPQVQNITGEEATGGRRRKAPTLPRYVRDQIQKLPPDQARRAERAFFLGMQVLNDLNADAMYLARAVGEEALAAMLAPFGITLRRHEPDEEEAKQRRAPLVEVSSKLSVQDLFKRLDDEPVQAIESTLYTENNLSAQSPYPYSTKDKATDKVSKCETEAPEPLSCEDLPTPQVEAEAIETQNAREPEAAEPPAEKTRSVEGMSTQKPADASAIVAYVEKLFGKNQSPVILRKFAALANENNTSPANVIRFLMFKMEEIITRRYPLRSAGAFLDFAQRDLPGWLTLNRRELGHSERREAPAPPPAVMPPAEELTSLERFLCEIPGHLDADATRARIAELREQLGDEAPAPYQPPTIEDEIARLEAGVREALDTRGPDAILDPMVKHCRKRIRELKQELGKAAGAAG